jgi:hypothetical protein
MITPEDAQHPIAMDKMVIESAISRLIATYAHYLDDGKFSEIADMMSHSTFDVLDQLATGRDEVKAFLMGGVQLHGDGTPRTWHSLSNILIDIEPSGDRALSISYFTVHQELEGFPLQPICTGRYHDTFECHEGEWRFTARAVQPRLFGELRFHVVSPDAANP